MNIMFVGLSGVPYLRRACDNRLMAFAKLFVKLGHHVTILNRCPAAKITDHKLDINYGKEITFIENINIDKPNSKIFQLLIFLVSYPLEFFRVLRINKKKPIDILHLYSGHYFEFLIYKFLSVLIGAKLIYQYVEFRSCINRNGIYHKINGYLCDTYLHKVFDGVISISKYLSSNVKGKAPAMPLVKVPPLCDYDYFDSIDTGIRPKKYILYCGSVGYFEVIRLIVSSYSLSSCVGNDICLILVVSGNDNEMRRVLEYVNNYSGVELQTNLPYIDLVKLYKGSFLCLIPLRNTIQDIARFPNKIGEYCASGSAFITTNVGEIPEYFADEINALIVNDNTEYEIAKKIDWAIENLAKVQEIGENAYKTGEKYFDTKAYESKMKNFLKEL